MVHVRSFYLVTPLLLVVSAINLPTNGNNLDKRDAHLQVARALFGRQDTTTCAQGQTACGTDCCDTGCCGDACCPEATSRTLIAITASGTNDTPNFATTSTDDTPSFLQNPSSEAVSRPFTEVAPTRTASAVTGLPSTSTLNTTSSPSSSSQGTTSTPNDAVSNIAGHGLVLGFMVALASMIVL